MVERDLILDAGHMLELPLYLSTLSQSKAPSVLVRKKPGD